MPHEEYPWSEHAKRLANGYRVNEPEKHDLGVIDPREQFRDAPEYRLGQLPEFYENYMLDNIAEYGGDPGAYACAFLPTMISVLHTTVEMQTRPKMDNWRNPNEHALILGKSGANKSGIFKDLTRYQMQWQEVLIKSAKPGRQRTKIPQTVLQNGSVEGVIRQCRDNNGERLIVANDEAMSFYQGSGSHHQGSGTSIMTDLVCKMYDGGPYYKALVKEPYSIPKMLGSMLMATTLDKFSGWADFNVMVTSGAMSRTTVCVISRPLKRDASLHIPGASEAMQAMMLKLRALRDCRFALEPSAHGPWSEFIDQREAMNLAIEESREMNGLAEWCRKYDMRIISMATVLQAIDFVNGNQLNYTPYDVPKTAADEDKVGGDAARQGKLIYITYENLERAINFVQGYLFESQKYFYKMADGVTEFGPELLSWVAARLTLNSPDKAFITRNDLVYKGPAIVRPKGGMTDAIKAKQDRWVRALLDHGYIEPGDNPRTTFKGVARSEEQLANYRIRQEFFEFFSSEETMAEFKAIHTGIQAKRDWSANPPRLGEKRN